MTLNKAGEALKALGLGAVRLRYRPADDLITTDSFTLWIDDGDVVGTGPTADAALHDALGKLTRKAA